jgi:hypothetical protein
MQTTGSLLSLGFLKNGNDMEINLEGKVALFFVSKRAVEYPCAVSVLRANGEEIITGRA